MYCVCGTAVTGLSGIPRRILAQPLIPAGSGLATRPPGALTSATAGGPPGVASPDISGSLAGGKRESRPGSSQSRMADGTSSGSLLRVSIQSVQDTVAHRSDGAQGCPSLGTHTFTACYRCRCSSRTMHDSVCKTKLQFSKAPDACDARAG